jgi:hypothetical protein
MKGGNICKQTQDTMNPSEIKRIIRCCYKSKVVSDKIINDLECENFSSKSVKNVLSKLESSNKRYALAMDPKVAKVMSSPVLYSSPIDDE